jgi:hypothetical protein
MKRGCEDARKVPLPAQGREEQEEEEEEDEAEDEEKKRKMFGWLTMSEGPKCARLHVGRKEKPRRNNARTKRPGSRRNCCVTTLE